MNNLASVALSIFMAYAVHAQTPVDWPNYTPFFSSPYYYRNRNVLQTQQKAPILHDNSGQHVLHRDAVMSVLLKELKENSKRWAETSQRLAETNDMVENVNKEMMNEIIKLKNELAQLKKLPEEKVAKEILKNESNDTKTQTEFLATKFETLTLEASKDGGNRTARFCNCILLNEITDLIGKHLILTNLKLNDIAYNMSRNLADTNVRFNNLIDNVSRGLVATNARIDNITNNIIEDLADTTDKLNDLTTQFQASINTTTIGGMPTSCADLKQLEYKKSGIFSVMVNNQVKNIYCDFTKSDSSTDFEKLIGIVDIKSIRVHFHGQLNATYTNTGNAVVFNQMLINEGNAMVPSTGIFTAPAAGTYFFAFSGLSVGTGEVRVELQRKIGSGNWESLGRAFGSDYNKETFSLEATLHLGKNDQIRMFLFQGSILDSSNHNTNFVGFLLEEELE